MAESKRKFVFISKKNRNQGGTSGGVKTSATLDNDSGGACSEHPPLIIPEGREKGSPGGVPSERKFVSQHYAIFKDLATLSGLEYNVCEEGLGAEFQTFLESYGVVSQLSSLPVEGKYNVAVLCTPPGEDIWKWNIFVTTISGVNSSPKSVKLDGKVFMELADTTYALGARVLRSRGGILKRRAIRLPSGYVLVEKGGHGARVSVVPSYHRVPFGEEFAFVPRQLLMRARQVRGTNALAQLESSIAPHTRWLEWAAVVSGKPPDHFWLRLHEFFVYKNSQKSIQARYLRAREEAAGKELLEERSDVGLVGSFETNTNLLPLIVGGARRFWNIARQAADDVVAWFRKRKSQKDVETPFLLEDPVSTEAHIPMGNLFMAARGAYMTQKLRKARRTFRHREGQVRWFRAALVKRRTFGLSAEYRVFKATDLSRKELVALAVDFALEEGVAWFFPPGTILIAIAEAALELLGPFTWQQWTVRQIVRFSSAFIRALFGPVGSLLAHLVHNAVALYLDARWCRYQEIIHRDRSLSGPLSSIPTIIAKATELERWWREPVPLKRPFLPVVEKLVFVRPFHFRPQGIPSIVDAFRSTLQSAAAVRFANDIRYKRTGKERRELNLKQELWVKNPFCRRVWHAINEVGYPTLSYGEAYKELSSNSRSRIGNRKVGTQMNFRGVTTAMVKRDEDIVVRNCDIGRQYQLEPFEYVKTRVVCYGSGLDLLPHAPISVAMSKAWKRNMVERGFVFRLEMHLTQMKGHIGCEVPVTYYFCYGFVKDFAKVVLNLRQDTNQGEVTVVIWAGGDDSLIGLNYRDRNEARFEWLEFDFSRFDSTQSISLLEKFWELGIFTETARQQLRAMYSTKTLRVKKNDGGTTGIPYYGASFSGTPYTSGRNTFVCWLAMGASFHAALESGDWKKPALVQQTIFEAGKSGFILKDESKGYPTFLANIIHCPPGQVRGVSARLTLGRIARAGKCTAVLIENDLLEGNNLCGVSVDAFHEQGWLLDGPVPLPSVDAGPFLVRYLGLEPLLKGGVFPLSDIEARYLDSCERLRKIATELGAEIPDISVGRWQEYIVRPYGNFTLSEYAKAVQSRYGLELDEASECDYRTVIGVDFGISRECWSQSRRQ